MFLISSTDPRQEDKMLKFFNDIIGDARAGVGFREMEREKKPAMVTGLCLSLNGQALVHVVEGPMSIMKKILRSIAAQQEEHGSMSMFQHPKVVSVTEEVFREYSFWVPRKITVNPEEPERITNAVKSCFDMYRPYLELARECGAMNEEKALDLVENGTGKNLMGKVCSAEMVKIICEQKDIPSVKEWLDIFDTPVDLVLESEKVWPVEPWLKY